MAYFFSNSFSIFSIMSDSTTVFKKIVLAEDDDDDYMVFKEILDELGINYQLIWAKDGVELMHQLDNSDPDMLFLDINMPRKNGFQCIDIIRRDRKWNLPVIIYSTSADAGTIQSMYLRKANFYICKPNSYPVLKQFLRKVFSIDWKKFKLSTRDFILSDNHCLFEEFSLLQ
jgi:CheY-like chemotaxis protein